MSLLALLLAHALAGPPPTCADVWQAQVECAVHRRDERQACREYHRQAWRLRVLTLCYDWRMP